MEGAMTFPPETDAGEIAESPAKRHAAPDRSEPAVAIHHLSEL
jgi:hypothetical protein